MCFKGNFINVCTYIPMYIYLITINKKEANNLKETKEGYLEGFGGMSGVWQEGDDVIIASSQK